MSNQAPPTLPLVLFPIAFAAIWLLVAAVLSELSGWSRLARAFPGGARPAGARINGAVMGMGPVGENGATTLIPTAGGLYIYANPVFRFRRPPVLVPWREIRNDGERGKLWWRNVVLDLGGVTSMRVRSRAYSALSPYLSKRSGKGAA